ncbi:hypothetical protein [Salisediminibacterium selenitireducens]|uniref:Uncharacterized protein n=1 Tax=Bacillus selenitireducens (strain ATCC 700615 / DSM 15326 / MLS10) TaxID=439292 RepID=D6XZZ8_BACIE|nr:hypothetical protein [Salisediminibacterium selenitireducens]ADI00500.1 hypothetical protein Bsel_3018 [[Bacillus] selenitireducens MLS10]
MDERAKTCFAYKSGKCRILDINRCEGSSCGFCKTEEQVMQERAESLAIIETLEPMHRDAIHEKYLNGQIGAGFYKNGTA